MPCQPLAYQNLISTFTPFSAVHEATFPLTVATGKPRQASALPIDPEPMRTGLFMVLDDRQISANRVRGGIEGTCLKFLWSLIVRYLGCLRAN